MQAINLISAVEASGTLEEPLFSRYIKNFGIDVLRAHEIEALKALVDNLYASANAEMHPKMKILDRYYIGYKIPQIGKEFDLLRIGTNCIVNIELKLESTNEKILKQLIRNQYYLSFLDKEVYCFTFVHNENKLYQLINNDRTQLVEADYSQLCDILNEMELIEITDIDALFNPNNYLVSPFNFTEKFITSEYFLTHQQEEIKKDILVWIDQKTKNFISLTGAAGTGKTLLIYDIAKELSHQDNQVLIIHCGNLNHGQILLNTDYKWNIRPVKYGYNNNFNDYDLIIVDEVQRIYPYQLKAIIDRIKAVNKKCIFSFDRKQCLSPDEFNWNNIDVISSISDKIYTLTTKIRTNKEIADFIKRLFDKSIPIESHNYPNVEISFFSTYANVRSHLAYLKDNGWTVFNYTPGLHKIYYYEQRYNIPGIADTPHSIIGQEFDNVVGVIDEYFFYDENQKLTENTELWRVGLAKYYSQKGMLYQILTRTRRRIHLVIINNKDILNRCLEIIGCL